MKIYNISLQSLRRKKSKTFFLVSGLTLAVAAAVSLASVSVTMNRNIEHELNEYGANIIITPESDNLSLNYGTISLGNISYKQSTLNVDDAAKLRQIKNSKNISVISPKLYEVAAIDSFSILVAGINFQNELSLKKWWEISGKAPDKTNEALAGSALASKFKLQLSDTLHIKGQDFIVTGMINPTGSNDDLTLFLGLKTVQQLFNREKNISLMEVSALCYDCPIDTIVAQASSILPNAKVTAVKQSINSKMNAVKNFTDFSLGIVFLILVISSLIVFTVVNSSINERVREIGLFKAVGLKNSEIFRIVFIEILLAGSVAGIAGYMMGTVIANLISPVLGAGHSDEFIVNPGLFLPAILVSVLMSLLASVVPAYKAAKLDPTTAFRTL